MRLLWTASLECLAAIMKMWVKMPVWPGTSNCIVYTVTLVPGVAQPLN
jgi:hypothetical protein